LDLVFATVGRSLWVLDQALFPALVAIVIATTLVTPLALRWSLAR
jgi:hypothetical protein